MSEINIFEATPETVSSDHEKFLFYGFAKTGKTFAALTAPDPIMCVLVGNKNEIKTIKSRAFREKYGHKKIYFAVAEESVAERGQFGDATLGEGAKGADMVSDIIDKALEKDADPDDPFHFKTLVVDNATMLTEFQSNKTIEISYDRAKNVQNTTLSRFRDKGVMFLSDDDYKGVMSINLQFVSWLFRIPKHVVLITHKWQKVAVDRKTKQETILMEKPQFVGKQRDDIPSLFDNIWHFEKDGQFYTATTEGNDRLIAGTRVGGIIDTFYHNVDLEESIAKLQEAWEDES